MPWVFIYREPVDVMQSLIARPPRWAVNETLSRFMGNGCSGGSVQTTFALENFFKAPLTHMNPLARAVNYSQLPAATLDIAIHFGLDLDAAEQGKIMEMGQYDAKDPGKIKFQAREPELVSNELASSLLQLHTLYQQWEQIRIRSEAAHAR